MVQNTNSVLQHFSSGFVWICFCWLLTGWHCEFYSVNFTVLILFFTIFFRDLSTHIHSSNLDQFRTDIFLKSWQLWMMFCCFVFLLPWLAQIISQIDLPCNWLAKNKKIKKNQYLQLTKMVEYEISWIRKCIMCLILNVDQCYLAEHTVWEINSNLIYQLASRFSLEWVSNIFKVWTILEIQ